MKQLKWTALILGCWVFIWSHQQANVAAGISCDKNELPCNYEDHCVAREEWCNGYSNCDDDSDEDYCKKSSFWNVNPNECEKSDMFLCNDGRCWPSVARCDGFKDCSDGNDEVDCEVVNEDKNNADIDRESTPDTKKDIGAENFEKNDYDYDDDDSDSEETTYASTIRSVTPTTAPSSTSSGKSFYDKRMEKELTTSKPVERGALPRRKDHRVVYPSVNQPDLRPQGRFGTSYSSNTPTLRAFRHYRGPYIDQSKPDYRRHPSYYHPNWVNGYPQSQYPNGVHGTRPYIHDPRYGYQSPLNGRGYNRQGSTLQTSYNQQRMHPAPFYFKSDYSRMYHTENSDAITAARAWILGPARSGLGDWGNDTTRALIALSLSGNNSWSKTPENDILRKKLQIYTGNFLLKDRYSISLNRLALLVQALLATCQDPRNFEGQDLTDLIRTRMAEQINRRSVNPLIYLTLCLAGQDLSNTEFSHLVDIVTRRTRDHEVGRDSFILALEAFACYLHQEKRYSQEHMKTLESLASNATYRLLQRMGDEGNFGSVYSTALAAQALMSLNDSRGWNHQETFAFLRNHQKEDGSFGDFLATYYALPALAGKSLLYLRNTGCGASAPRTQELLPWEILNHLGEKFFIRYSLHFGNPLTNAHTIQLLVPRGINFYDVMRVAEYENKHFRFSTETVENKTKVFSISDTPNDPVLGMAWYLYTKPLADGNIYVPNPHDRLTGDIKSYLPTADKHIIFWYHPVGEF